VHFWKIAHVAVQPHDEPAHTAHAHPSGQLQSLHQHRKTTSSNKPRPPATQKNNCLLFSQQQQPTQTAEAQSTAASQPIHCGNRNCSGPTAATIQCRTARAAAAVLQDCMLCMCQCCCIRTLRHKRHQTGIHPVLAQRRAIVSYYGNCLFTSFHTLLACVCSATT
jgi:hypothetical protein